MLPVASGSPLIRTNIKSFVTMADGKNGSVARRDHDVGIEPARDESNHAAPNLALQVPPRVLVEVINNPASVVVAHLAKVDQPSHHQRRNTTLLHSASSMH